MRMVSACVCVCVYMCQGGTALTGRWRLAVGCRKLSAQLHAQVFLFRKMRSIYQKQADKVKKQLEELELQKEAKLNRLQLGGHGVQSEAAADLC